jgi:DNA-directed RNA polymerase specialized sigma subunit
MAALRRVLSFGEWRERFSWRRAAMVSRSMAKDFGVPEDTMTRVLAEAREELQALAAIDVASDARPVINKAIDKLAEYGRWGSRSRDDALLNRWAQQLPEREYMMLRLWKKEGRSHAEIAEILGTDVESVRTTLVKVYVDLRMKMGRFGSAACDRELDVANGDDEIAELAESDERGAGAPH